MLFVEELKQILPELENIFEVGAHRGNDILEIKKVWPESNVFAFEADPFNYEICNSKCGDIDGVEVVNLAAFDKNETLTFNRFCDIESIPDEDTMKGSNMQFTGCGSLMKPGAGLTEIYKIDEVTEEIEVTAVTLESFCKDYSLSQIDALFMDVQGAEMNVIRGCGDLVNDIKVIILEWSTWKTLYEGETDFLEIKAYLENELGTIEAGRQFQLKGLNGDSIFIKKGLLNV